MHRYDPPTRFPRQSDYRPLARADRAAFVAILLPAALVAGLVSVAAERSAEALRQEAWRLQVSRVERGARQLWPVYQAPVTTPSDFGLAIAELEAAGDGR